MRRSETSLNEYIKSLNSKIRRSTKQMRQEGYNIPYDSKPADICFKYDQQNGFCSISNQKMTHVLCSKISMKKKYPKNIAIKLIDPSLGYLISNITLICCEHCDYVNCPGFIKDPLNQNSRLYQPYPQRTVVYQQYQFPSEPSLLQNTPTIMNNELNFANTITHPSLCNISAYEQEVLNKFIYDSFPISDNPDANLDIVEHWEV